MYKTIINYNKKIGLLTRNNSRVYRRIEKHNQEHFLRQDREKLPDQKTSGRKTHVVGDTEGATWIPPRTSGQWQSQLKHGAQFLLLCLHFEQRLQR